MSKLKVTEVKGVRIESHYPNTSWSEHVKDNSIFIHFSLIKIGGYRLQFKFKGSKVFAKFGCKEVTLEEVESAIKQLNGEKIEGTMRKMLFRNGMKAPLKAIVIEESTSFYITSKGKGYAKKDYELKEHLQSNEVLTTKKRGNYVPNTYYCFKGEQICRTDDKKYILAILNYLAELMTEINKHI